MWQLIHNVMLTNCSSLLLNNRHHDTHYSHHLPTTKLNTFFILADKLLFTTQLVYYSISQLAALRVATRPSLGTTSKAWAGMDSQARFSIAIRDLQTAADPSVLHVLAIGRWQSIPTLAKHQLTSRHTSYQLLNYHLGLPQTSTNFLDLIGDQCNRKWTTQCVIQILCDQCNDTRSSKVGWEIDGFQSHF